MQFARTAETGTVGQPANVLDPACRLSVQPWRCEPLRTNQPRLAGAEAETVPESGWAAWKLIVLGVADSDPNVAEASGSRD